MNGTDRDFRTEHDSMGEVRVPSWRHWGAQTERSRQNFPIGGDGDRMPVGIIRALAVIKKASARVNSRLLPSRMSDKKLAAIEGACDEIISGALDDDFPLVVWQTGSGTQTNMNLNEVIAFRANEALGQTLCHPNDDVNMSQSSNDVFPSAMHVAAVLAIEREVIPAARSLASTLSRLENENADAVKCGRTHLQDATPVTFGQEISGWRSSVETDADMLASSLGHLRSLALGGTAVGTGLNAPEGFGTAAADEISKITGTHFYSSANKFHSLTSKSELVLAHGALKALAADLNKIANDIRFLSSGPRCGYGEIKIPENEPGSSIMPGKVNPTQCEAVTMVALQIMADDVAVTYAAAGGNFELNVLMPVLAYNFLHSCRLLADVMRSFEERCVRGIVADRERMHEYLDRSLMSVTALTPHIGYERATRVAHEALERGLSLRQSCQNLGYLTGDEFDRLCRPEKMV